MLNTVLKESEGLYKEKGSSFISYLFPITCEEELKTKLKNLKSEYKNASHFCYAFRIGKQRVEERCSDDGEPSGTAGLPILNTLKSNELSNCACVVVRIYGGTKLGASGLINAYKLSTEESVENNVLGILELRHYFFVSFPYEATPMINSIISQHKLQIESQKFEELCEFELSSNEDINELIFSSLHSFSKSQVKYMGYQ